MSLLFSDYPVFVVIFAARLSRCYGTNARSILGNAKEAADLFQFFGYNLYEAEVNWLVSREWALTSEDIFWRRTKLGLRLTADEVVALDSYLGAHLAELLGTAA